MVKTAEEEENAGRTQQGPSIIAESRPEKDLRLLWTKQLLSHIVPQQAHFLHNFIPWCFKTKFWAVRVSHGIRETASTQSVPTYMSLENNEKWSAVKKQQMKILVTLLRG